MTIKLPKETTEDLLLSIQQYFRERLDQELGNVQSQMLLEYFLTEIGPAVYNQAIRDAQSYFQERTMDLEGSCYEPEMTYGTGKDQRRR